MEFASVLRGGRGTDVTGLVEEGFELLGDLELSRSDRQRLRALAKHYLAVVGAQT